MGQILGRELVDSRGLVIKKWCGLQLGPPLWLLDGGKCSWGLSCFDSEVYVAIDYWVSSNLFVVCGEFWENVREPC